METKRHVLEQRLESIKRELTTLGELRPGSLSQQYNVCGSSTCRCKANPPKKHGPYTQLSWTRKRKSKTRFVGKAELASVRQQTDNYERLQGLVEQWIDLAIELSDITLKQAKQDRKHNSTD